MPYTEAFKAQMVRRMMGPPAVSASALEAQVGVAQPTLSKWLRKAREAAARAPVHAEERVLPSETKPKSWTAEEKLRVLAEAHGLTGEPLGELLRREGVHEAQLRAWRDVAAGALAEASPSAKATTAGERRHAAAAAKQVKELQRELRRKEKALAEAAALLVLEKKLKALGLDVEDDDTDDRSDR